MLQYLFVGAVMHAFSLYLASQNTSKHVDIRGSQKRKYAMIYRKKRKEREKKKKKKKESIVVIFDTLVNRATKSTI